MFGFGNGAQQGGNDESKTASVGGGAHTVRGEGESVLNRKPTASSALLGTSTTGFSGSEVQPTFGASSNRRSFGISSSRPPVLSTAAGGSAGFGSGSGFGPANTKFAKWPGSETKSIGFGSATSSSNAEGPRGGAGFDSAPRNGAERAFGSGALYAFGGVKSTRGTPTAETRTSVGFGSGGGFGTGGGFGSGAGGFGTGGGFVAVNSSGQVPKHSTTTFATRAGGDGNGGRKSSPPASGFGAGTGFDGNSNSSSRSSSRSSGRSSSRTVAPRATAEARPKVNLSVFSPKKQPQPAAQANQSSPEGENKSSWSGGSFADAARRGATSSTAWAAGLSSGASSAPGSNTGGSNFARAPAAPTPKSFGTGAGLWTKASGKFPTLADAAGRSSPDPKRPTSTPDEGGTTGRNMAPPTSGEHTTAGKTLSWGGGLLTASRRAAERERRKSALSVQVEARDSEPGRRPVISGLRDDTSHAFPSTRADALLSTSAGAKASVISFGRRPPGDSSARVPGTGDDGGKNVKRKAKSNRESSASSRGKGILDAVGRRPRNAPDPDPPSSTNGAHEIEGGKINRAFEEPPASGSKIMGGFGGPPPGLSLDPPTFLGHDNSADGASAKNNRKRSTTSGASRILGAFEGAPPGGSSDPPLFVGGQDKGADGGGLSETTTSSSLEASEDAAAKARRAQRFSSSLRTMDGSSSSRTKGSHHAATGAGDVTGSGGGSAEDVQRGSHLDAAQVKVGTVEAMCPLEERLRRIPGDLHILEKEHPALLMPAQDGGVPQQLWAHDDLVVKRHQRAAAGMDISKPELLRTPLWLARTVDHLVFHCVDKGPQGGGDPSTAWDDPRVRDYMVKFRANNPSRADVAEEETAHDLYNFVWDRFRQIRSDYNMQGYNPVVGLVSEASIVAHERMARWYILMANRMEKNAMATLRFNLKSVVETLKKLYEFYSIRVARGELIGGLASPNEPEIMAYYLLTVLEQDDGVEVQRLVKELVRSRRERVLDSPEMKGALRVVRAWHAGDYVAFFRALRGPDIMHRCLLSQYVKAMRNTAINVIAASFLDFSVGELMRLLCFEDEDQTIAFLEAYGLQADLADRVPLRGRDRNGTYMRLFRRPEAIPDPPPLQDIVEPRPWPEASVLVCKGDSEPVADKSHDVTGAGVRRQAGELGTPMAGSATLERGTSSSSTLSTVSAGARGLRAKVVGMAGSLAAAVTPGKVLLSQRSSRASATAGSGPSSSPRPDGPSGPTSGLFGQGAEASAGMIASVGTSADAKGFSFRASSTLPAVSTSKTTDLETAPEHGSSSRQQQRTNEGFSFGSPASRTDTAERKGGSASAADVPAELSFDGLSAAGRGFGDGKGVNEAGIPQVNAVSHGSGTSRTLPQHSVAAGAFAAGDDPAFPTFKSAHKPGLLSDSGHGLTPRSTPSSANVLPSSAQRFPGAHEQQSIALRSAASRSILSTSGDGFSAANTASAAATSAAAAAKMERDKEALRQAVEDGQRRMTLERRQQEEAADRRRKEEAETRRQVAAAKAAQELERERVAVTRARRALSTGKLVPSEVIQRLPVDGELRRLALDHRRSLGLRLSKLGTAVVTRKQSCAWISWVKETSRWLDAQHTIEHRNLRFEEHSTLLGKTPFLRRYQKRLRWSGDAEADATARRAEDSRFWKMGKPAAQSKPAASDELRKPDPLDLAAIIAPGLAKNEGVDAEKAFAGVGQGAVQGRSAAARSPDGIKSERDARLSLPHLFWKAVVVAPSRSRGNVGDWLEAKLGGEGTDQANYLRALAANGVCPQQQGLSMVMQQGAEVVCGPSCRARIVHRAFRKVIPRSPRAAAKAQGFQFMHLCVRRIDVVGQGLQLSPQLRETSKAASVVIFAATPRDQDRFFWSPLHPKPDWSQARTDLRCALEAASSREDSNADQDQRRVPVLVVIPVKDSALRRGTSEDPNAGASVRRRILEEAWSGLGLKDVAKMGSSFRVVVVGLHEFESRSKVAAAAGERLVFASAADEDCSKELGVKLSELTEQAPRQPLVATRSLQEMLKTAISRASTDNSFAELAKLGLPASRFEDPPLSAVVDAATRASQYVYRLVERKHDAWPMEEFAVVQNFDVAGQSSVTGTEHPTTVAYVPGAARPSAGEISASPLPRPEVSDVLAEEATARRLVEASGGLPLDWALANAKCASHAVAALVKACTLPSVPSELEEAFRPEALLGGRGARPLGAREAWARVELLDGYLSRHLVPEELRFRLAEALAGGVMMRGSPPPWRTLVRDAVLRKLTEAFGEAERACVVHFVVASGQERLAPRRDDVAPGLLTVKDFHEPVPPSTGHAAVSQSERTGLSRVSAALKRAAPVGGDPSLTRHSSKHPRTRAATWTCSSDGGRGAGDGPPKRRLCFGGRDDEGENLRAESVDDEQILEERIRRIALETQDIRASRQRDESVANGERDLDRAFLASFGRSLSSQAEASGKIPKTDFNIERVLANSVPGRDVARAEATNRREGEEARRQKVKATLSPGAYARWIVREEIEECRRQEEGLRSAVYDSDPFLRGEAWPYD